MSNIINTNGIAITELANVNGLVTDLNDAITMLNELSKKHEEVTSATKLLKKREKDLPDIQIAFSQQADLLEATNKICLDINSALDRTPKIRFIKHHQLKQKQKSYQAKQANTFSTFNKAKNRLYEINGEIKLANEIISQNASAQEYEEMYKHIVATKYNLIVTYLNIHAGTNFDLLDNSEISHTPLEMFELVENDEQFTIDDTSCLFTTEIEEELE